MSSKTNPICPSTRPAFTTSLQMFFMSKSNKQLYQLIQKNILHFYENYLDFITDLLYKLFTNLERIDCTNGANQ